MWLVRTVDEADRLPPVAHHLLPHHRRCFREIDRAGERDDVLALELVVVHGHDVDGAQVADVVSLPGHADVRAAVDVDVGRVLHDGLERLEASVCSQQR